MKTQKLIVIAAIVCLLVGASGAAMAENTCPEGVIYNEVVILDVVVTKANCIIQNSTILGNVIVQNKQFPVGVFVMVDNVVSGNVDVNGGATVLTQNKILSDPSQPALRVRNGVGDSVVEQNVIQGGGNMLIIDNDQIAVLNNLIGGGGSMVLRLNDEVLINRNIMYDGDMRCVNNEQELATENIAINGRITCFGQ